LKIKQTYRLRFIALFLLALTLVGSVGVNADFHICQNKVKAIAILDLADGCSEMETAITCDVASSDEAAIAKQKCCTNEHVFAKASFENVQAMGDFQIESFAVSLFANLVSVELPKENTQTYSKKPPTLWQVSSGLHIAFQQFLI